MSIAGAGSPEIVGTYVFKAVVVVGKKRLEAAASPQFGFFFSVIPSNLKWFRPLSLGLSRNCTTPSDSVRGAQSGLHCCSRTEFTYLRLGNFTTDRTLENCLE